MKLITVENRQTTLDIAIQEYGGVEALFDLVNDNLDNGLAMGIQTNLVGGSKLRIKSSPVNTQVYQLFSRKALKPVSAFNFTPPEGMSGVPDHNQFDYNPEDYA